MKRYIDADKLIEILIELKEIPTPGVAKATDEAISLGLSLAVREVRKLPVADVVEVVRCKDCKHCWQYTGIDKMHYIECTFDPECNTPIHEMHFCSYGERK